ncbi:hypothetical protein BOTBODRAFT_61950 [Botryobasidium botryosum FD-172 SS1]|uniref:Uncharacterized protein n=1 Tax=Botryobasidium botryosum (strain FD-172 SS1) TaxID=930990 RepID=A0A067N1R8_BOTB1|nr:hypothetical protein BOTBODRAFT_61950 [Botryobasidium botryosum FD-172 SS1]
MHGLSLVHRIEIVSAECYHSTFNMAGARPPLIPRLSAQQRPTALSSPGLPPAFSPILSYGPPIRKGNNATVHSPPITPSNTRFPEM